LRGNQLPRATFENLQNPFKNRSKNSDQEFLKGRHVAPGLQTWCV
jgi:hypothetical protein